MRDAYDAMMWNDHHDQFSEWVDKGVRSVAGRLARIRFPASAVPGQLFAAFMAVSITLLTFGASAV